MDELDPSGSAAGIAGEPREPTSGRAAVPVTAPPVHGRAAVAPPHPVGAPAPSDPSRLRSTAADLPWLANLARETARDGSWRLAGYGSRIDGGPAEPIATHLGSPPPWPDEARAARPAAPGGAMPPAVTTLAEIPLALLVKPTPPPAVDHEPTPALPEIAPTGLAPTGLAPTEPASETAPSGPGLREPVPSLSAPAEPVPSAPPPEPPVASAPVLSPSLPTGAASAARRPHGSPIAVPTATAAEPAPGRAPAVVPRWPWRRIAKRAAVSAIALFAAWLVAVLGMIVAFRYVDPPFSNLMLFHRLTGEVVVQSWLPVERMPAQLIRAIVVSEDGRFCSHRGIDLKEIELAIERSKDGTPRGASTITMQVAKNLFLWPSKSYVRKALEVPLTLAIEALWSKRRIFEVYANIAEWGPGVFGVEAAAGYHFGKSAARVGEREAALLAVALPNPVTRDAGDPGPGTERLANVIQSRMRAMSRAASCVERAPRG